MSQALLLTPDEQAEFLRPWTEHLAVGGGETEPAVGSGSGAADLPGEAVGPLGQALLAIGNQQVRIERLEAEAQSLRAAVTELNREAARRRPFGPAPAYLDKPG